MNKRRPDISSAAVSGMTPTRAIELAGGTQDKLAEVMGVTRQAVVQWVKDEHIPAGKLMVMIQRFPQWFK
jgi:hypothetical protein